MFVKCLNGKCQLRVRAEIKQIADYFKDLEEGLVEWDYRGISLDNMVPPG